MYIGDQQTSNGSSLLASPDEIEKIISQNSDEVKALLAVSEQPTHHQ
jgi:hypothetical protein